jgi:predicted ATPase/DNA-binding SARP family transcriptional activator
MVGVAWYIRLLGGLIVERDGAPFVRFQTRKTGGLVGYLAYQMPAALARDVLIEQFWPHLDLDGGRNCLSTSLSSLRRQLEPPGVPPGSVILSTRLHVQLNPASVRTDTQEFSGLVNAATESVLPEEIVHAAEQAMALYRGYLLPGCYEDWVEPERERLAASFVHLMRRSVEALERSQEMERALEFALTAASAAPDQEATHCDVIRMNRRLGRDLEAVRQYRLLEERMRSEFGRGPSEATARLLDGLGTDRLAERRLRRQRDQRHSVSIRSLVERQNEPAPRPNAPSPAAQMPPLPASMTRFFGREDEIDLLCASLSAAVEDEEEGRRPLRNSRLVTITGPAGAGKTRLALEVARRQCQEFGGQVAFASLSGVTDVAQFDETLLSAVGVRTAISKSGREQVAAALAGRRCLLVLDNAEHLGVPLAKAILSLLERASDVSLLVTSRVPLGVDGEQLFPLRPLATPTHPGTPERLLEYASVRIFVDRAQGVSPDFQITPRNAAAIAAVCEKLEGIPLAIELAAARVSALTPAQMLTELERRFRFLISKQRTVEDRHKTLEAALAWSYDLLPATSQRFFARLSVFRGGWTLEGARALWTEVDDKEDALDHLERLVEQALVTTDEVAGAKRFIMLESVREFADLRLNQEDRDAARSGLVDYIVRLAEHEGPRLRGSHSAEAVARLQPELVNVRTVLAAACDRPYGLLVPALIWRLWSISGRAEEGVEWLRKGLMQDPESGASLRISALVGLCNLQRFVGRAEDAFASATEALFLARHEGDLNGQAEALNGLAILQDEQGNPDDALELLEESRVIRRQLSDTWGEAVALNNLARVAERQGKLEQARRSYEESRDLFKVLGDWSMVAISLLNLGVTSDSMSDYSTARAAYEESLILCRELGNRREIGVLLYNLGEAMFRECDHPDARRYVLESIDVRLELGDRAGVALPLSTLGAMAARKNDYIRATRLYAAADSIHSEYGTVLNAAGHQIYLEEIAIARDALNSQDFEAAWRFGRNLTLDQAVAYAMDKTVVAEADRLQFASITNPLAATLCPVG